MHSWSELQCNDVVALNAIRMSDLNGVVTETNTEVSVYTKVSQALVTQDVLDSFLHASKDEVKEMFPERVVDGKPFVSAVSFNEDDKGDKRYYLKISQFAKRVGVNTNPFQKTDTISWRSCLVNADLEMIKDLEIGAAMPGTLVTSQTTDMTLGWSSAKRGDSFGITPTGLPIFEATVYSTNPKAQDNLLDAVLYTSGGKTKRESILLEHINVIQNSAFSLLNRMVQEAPSVAPGITVGGF